MAVLALPLFGQSQQQNLPLNREFGLVNHKAFNAYSSSTHTSFQPIIQSHINTISDSVLSNSEKDLFLINVNKTYLKDRSWVARKLFFENFILVDTGNFYMTIDPLFNAELGSDLEDESSDLFYKNTRGVIVRSNIGTKFSFETSVYENQMTVPSYLNNYVKSTGIMPGQGRVKNFKEGGYDFAASSAIITYTPAKFLSLQMGTGKHFVGDGYRSMLLSDFSFNYPFYKLITTFGKKNQFQYTKLNASLSSITRRDLSSTPEALFKRKDMSIHYFSWMATKWLNIGLFESTIWQTEDANETKPYQFQQLNPIIGINTLTTGFNDPNHSLVGSNLKLKLPFKTILYNQFVYDGSARFGYQIGVKYAGFDNLTLQAEYNSAEPSTYYSQVPLQAYSNYNEPLAHPTGQDFKELVLIANYKYKRIFAQMKLVQSVTPSIDSVVTQTGSGPTGSITQYLETELTTKSYQFHVGYVVNPKNNMSLLLGINFRNQTTPNAFIYNTPSTTHYVYFGFRTNLRNLYNDF